MQRSINERRKASVQAHCKVSDTWGLLKSGVGWDTEIDGPCFLTDVQFAGKAKSLCLQNKGWVTCPGNPPVDQLLECFPSVLPACLQLLLSGQISLGNLFSFRGITLHTVGSHCCCSWGKNQLFPGSPVLLLKNWKSSHFFCSSWEINAIIHRGRVHFFWNVTTLKWQQITGSSCNTPRDWWAS